MALIARLFAWIAHKILLAIHNKEHTIQSLFGEIMKTSIGLKQEKKESISLLSEAGQNEWIENLSGRLSKSFEEINKMALEATNKSITLRRELEDSTYKDIFNFPKYDHWIKTQILSPIDELLILVTKNMQTIRDTLNSIDMQNRKKP